MVEQVQNHGVVIELNELDQNAGCITVQMARSIYVRGNY